MALRFEQGDIVKGNYPAFCQQVNCKGVMGAGLAKQIREKYPEVYTSYKNHLWRCNDFGESPLGSVNVVHLSDGRWCANMFAQNTYGRTGIHTDYSAFRKCLEALTLKLTPNIESIAFPYGIGCGLAGGDWYLIKGLIENFSHKVKQKVIIVVRE